MHLTKVKICGITNLKDALAAVDMGADLLGFNFYKKSPRYIDPADALAIINKIPTFVDTAGIFVNMPLEEIKNICDVGFLNWIQLHGDETPEFCDSLRWMHAKTIKALRIQNKEDIDKIKLYHTDAVLLDAFHPEVYGGSGETFNWKLIESVTVDKRVFLAGGIHPGNAEEAVETGVYGIDLCSGIEAEPGTKDHDKMRQLFENIKHVRH